LIQTKKILESWTQGLHPVCLILGGLRSLPSLKPWLALIRREDYAILQAGLLIPGSTYSLRLPLVFSRPEWPRGRVRPRLQRRDHAGLAPASLL